MEIMEQQQLEPQLPKKHVWVERDEEDEEEEPGVGLVARQSKNQSNGAVQSGIAATSTFTTASDELEPASAPTKETSSEYSEEEEKGEEADDNSGGNEELGNVNEEDRAVKVEAADATTNSVYLDKLQGIWKCRHCNWTHQIGSPCILDVQNHKGCMHMTMTNQTVNQGEPCFTLETKGSESINGVSEMQPEIPKGHEETDTSFEHFENAAILDANEDLIGETEEDSLEYEVERVVKKQNTHDLYCPNCSSCITRTVILRRRKPKVPTKRLKSKRPKKLDPIPAPVAGDRRGDLPEIESDVTSTTPAPGVQDSTTEQGQKALHCLSCFSFFIPIGNGCFKIFQMFRRGKQNESTPSPLEVSQTDNRQSPLQTSQMENTQSSQKINLSENTRGPAEMSQNIESPQAIGQNEDTESPQKISHSKDTQSPSKISHDDATQYPQKVSHDDKSHGLQQISENVDAQNQNESKQSPQKIPAARTNWIFSVFGFHKGKETVKKGDHISSVQDAAVPKVSGTSGEHVDGAVMKRKEPGISNVFPPINGSLLDKVKGESKERKIDAGMLKKNDGDNELDLEAGLLEPSYSPRTEAEPSAESRAQNEDRAVVAGEAHEWEILKSIVYGGLIESITSVGIVSSAAGAGADTLNVLALGLANLFGGLLIIIHNLRELKKNQHRGASSEIDGEEDRYQALLGRRQNFTLHATVAILSYIIFGLIPPVVYGFSFRKSDEKELKLAAVAGASLACIFLLALGKGHVKKPHKTYFKTVSYYVGLGITASGISYVVGVLIKRLLEQLGLFESSSVVSGMPFLGTIPSGVGRASY